MHGNLFPVDIKTDVYKYFIDNTLNCHWHGDFEFGMLLAGAVDFYINNTHIKLEKGDGYFINSNILHMGKQSKHNEDAVMFALTFPAAVIASDINGVVYEKYVATLLNTRIDGFKILNGSQTGKEIKILLNKIYELDASEFGYELECMKNINQLWLAALQYIKENKGDLLHRNDDMKQIERMKKILSYVHAHYNEKITADDIADYVNVSRGECFRSFKNFMNKKLVEYINEYRLQRAAGLLRETEMTVIDVCLKCGFENASYFGKIFKEVYRITPYQYKKAHIWTGNKVQHINGMDYEYWKDSGNGKMLITEKADNGSFFCEWSNSNEIMFRSGKRYYKRDQTHSQIGNISLKFDVSYSSNGLTYLAVYGWTVDPLVEWYIVEHFISHNPKRDFTRIGTLDADGDEYQLYHFRRINKPTILGYCTNFEQYWSVRTTGRMTGTVDVSRHFRAWEELGLSMGRIAEINLTVESILSSGNAEIRTNILKIEK